MFKSSLKPYFPFLFFIFLWLLASNAVAQVNFQRFYHYSALDTGSVEDVVRQPFILLKKEYQTPTLHNRGVYWLKLSITHNPSPKKDLIVNIANPNLDVAVLYQRISGNIVPTDTKWQ